MVDITDTIKQLESVINNINTANENIDDIVGGVIEDLL